MTVKSQQPQSPGHGEVALQDTRHECDWKVSQKLASLPLQSSSDWQLMPKPVGGLLHTLSPLLSSQTHPISHSLDELQAAVQ